MTSDKKISASEKKWGKDVMGLGFSVLPSLLFQAQKRLGLSANQLAILVQLADFWWDSDKKPFPTKKKLSERLGIGERQIQRYIAEMEQSGLVKRTQRYSHVNNSRLSNEYDLSGLVERLNKLAPEFKGLKDETKAKRIQIEKRGGLKNMESKGEK